MPRSYYDAVIRAQSLKCKVNCAQTLFFNDDNDK